MAFNNDSAFNNQEKKLQGLAKLSRRFIRVADLLVNAANTRNGLNAGSKSLHRANDIYDRTDTEYENLKKRLEAVSNEYL